MSNESSILQRFGAGKVKQEQKEILRCSILNELEGKGLIPASGSAAAASEEVEKFLENGHLSGPNLSRLERRVAFRMQGGDSSALVQSAREHVPPVASPFSRSVGSRTPRQSSRPQSVEGIGSLVHRNSYEVSFYNAAQGSPSKTGHAFNILSDKGSSRSVTPSVVSQSRGSDTRVSTAEDQEIPKWSELAAYAKRVGDADKIAQRTKDRATKEKMRQVLKEQMLEKESRRMHKTEELKQDVDRVKVELQAWKEEEDAVMEEQRRIAVEVRKEREIQNLVVNALRQDERRKKLDDDNEQLLRNERELEQEKQMLKEKKNVQKVAMLGLMADWAEDRDKRTEIRKLQAKEEQAKVTEYQKMLDDQLARNKRATKPREPKGEYKPPDKAERKKLEKQFDEQVMSMVRAENAKALEAEKKEQREKSKARQCNREFLMEQIMERQRARNQREQEKLQQKDASKAAVEQFKDSEQQRKKQERQKYVQHRLELESQIAQKKADPARLKADPGDDSMTHAEVAMNRRLLAEARNVISNGAAVSDAALKMTLTF